MNYMLLPFFRNALHLEILNSQDTQIPDTQRPDTQEIINKTTTTMSVNHHIQEIHQQIHCFCTPEEECQLLKNIHPLEFLYSPFQCGNTFLPISKIKHQTPIFYDLIEILSELSVFTDEPWVCGHEGKHQTESMNALRFLRGKNSKENAKDFHFSLEKKEPSVSLSSSHFLYFSESVPIHSVLLSLLQFQKVGGMMIFSTSQKLVSHSMSQLVYFLSNLYQKTFVVKPTCSNSAYSTKYIVCHSFSSCPAVKKDWLLQLFLYGENCKLDNTLPYFFFNKLEEIHVILGLQQLNALDEALLVWKSKNREDKFELMKKLYIQKCIYWCEKYTIPYNDPFYKMNYFLGNSSSSSSGTSPLSLPFKQERQPGTVYNDLWTRVTG